MEALYNHLAKKTGTPGIKNEILSAEDWRLKRRLFEGKENLNAITPNKFGSRGQQLMARYCLLAQKYDLAIHPHGTKLQNGDMAVYSYTAPPLVKQAASHLGLSRALVVTHGLYPAAPHILGLEIGANSPMLDFDKTHKKIASLVHIQDTDLPQEPAIDEYLFIGDVTTKTAKEHTLRSHYEPFEPLTPHDAEAFHSILGSDALKLIAYSWDGPSYDPTGWRGELLAQLPLPPSHLVSDNKVMNF